MYFSLTTHRPHFLEECIALSFDMYTSIYIPIKSLQHDSCMHLLVVMKHLDLQCMYV